MVKIIIRETKNAKSTDFVDLHMFNSSIHVKISKYYMIKFYITYLEVIDHKIFKIL